MLQKKFILVTKQRSGSTWLIDILNNDPQITAYEEVFIDRPVTDRHPKKSLLPPIRYYDYKNIDTKSRPWKLFDYLNKINDSGKGARATGYKLMYGQYLVYPEIALKAVMDRYKVIHLIRKNHLDSVISALHAKQKEKPHIVDADEHELHVVRVRINTSSLIKELSSHKNRITIARIFLFFLPCPVCEIYYEDLCISPIESLGKIMSFLGMKEPAVANSSFRKIVSGSYREKIENYEEVRKVLLDSPYGNLID